MGSGRWDCNSYNDATTYRAANSIPDFDYDNKVKTGKAVGIHPDLDPKKVAGPTSPFAGQNIRESRDNTEHPESVPVVVNFDDTGSMGVIPMEFQKNLAKLMDVIIAKAGVKDPQVLVGAIGDSHCDRYPFQIGQFESDNRFDEQLRNLIIERGGGGQNMESYGLAYRFAAYHTATDAFDKRGKQGYFFTMGDEMPWPTITSEEVQRVFGVNAETDETVEDLLAKASEKWQIFHLHIQEGSYRDNNEVISRWRKLLGERLILVEDSNLVCEIIAGIIHMMETAAGVDKVVNDIGLHGASASSVKNALVPIANTLVPGKVASGNLPVGH